MVFEFQYADDDMVCGQSEDDMRVITDAFVEVYTKISLNINVWKTKIWFAHATSQNKCVNAKMLKHL